MKSLNFYFQIFIHLALMVLVAGFAHAQQADIQFYRQNNKTGINVFETSKRDTVTFDRVKVRVGGDFAIQFQTLNQSNTANNLVNLGSNFNLPTANLNLDVQLLDGVRMHLRTYLSSRHHNETWIKGGHLQIDKLDFIKPGFLENLMKYTTITVGMDEFNYGDVHFRRTDNARAIFNPFVGNYIMDSFSTEAFGELTFQNKGLLFVAGITNGKLNQNVVVNQNTDNQPSFYGKLGYDNQFTDDLRVRLTGSCYINYGTTTGTWLYGGDRAGSRYYNVLHTLPDTSGNTEGGSFDGRFNARFTKLIALQINPFIKFRGIEFFGVYEVATGYNEFTVPQTDKEGAFTQIGAELLYRFGRQENFYIGARYNQVYGKLRESQNENLDITRINASAGWLVSNNILVKVEYVKQEYRGNSWAGRFAGAEFNGIIMEAVVSF